VGHVEIHFHLLPGVDDGPASVADSIELARAAVADGTSTVIATPHVHAGFVNDPSEVPDRVRDLSEQLRREHVPLEVIPGGEIAHQMVGRLSQRQLDAIAHGPQGRRWVLLEAPFDGLNRGFVTAADELRQRGFAVVVAHPERVAKGWRTRRALAHELAAGSVLQLTAGSFTGLFGDGVRAEALRLAAVAPRVAVASDAHGAFRMPALGQALKVLLAAGARNPGRFADAVPRELLERGLVNSRARAAA
jgi:protein-tyrosine phosphatase